MLPGEVTGQVEGFIATLERVAPGQVAAVYAVGAIALDDFSDRLSNIDLVVVADPRLTPAQTGRLARAEHGLKRVGRRAAIWYTSWEEVADDPGVPAGATEGSDSSPPTPSPQAAAAPAGPSPQATAAAAGPPPQATAAPPRSSSLATPLTRAVLRNDAVALTGPDWPVVGYDGEGFRAWCRDRVRTMAAGSNGLLVMRRAVTPLVLEAARLAQGAVTGRLMSRTEAGESVGPLVSTRYRRILTDAVGFRAGARTSMYWGPFERKYDALILLRDLARLAQDS